MLHILNTTYIIYKKLSYIIFKLYILISILLNNFLKFYSIFDYIKNITKLKILHKIFSEST